MVGTPPAVAWPLKLNQPILPIPAVAGSHALPLPYHPASFFASRRPRYGRGRSASFLRSLRTSGQRAAGTSYWR